jgi:coenzyme F420 hydrogenase subunit beta
LRKPELYRSIKKSEGKTIQEVVEQGLCTGCGTCIAICPENALTVMECSKRGTYLPRLNDTKCSQCGICLRICPGAEANFKELNLLAFNEEPKNALIGNYLNCYAGYSTDQKLRYKSASGGLVTALSAFALETGDVDGVLVTRMSSEIPLKPQPFIARTKEEIMSAAGSKYCPVSANVVLKEIIEKKGRYIVVGLPCHIQGLRKAQVLNKKLRDRVLYCFGLVCNHTPSFQATKYLLKKFKIPEEKIAKLDYRGKGWPGGMNIVLDDDSEIFIPWGSSHYWGMVFQRFFWPIRCMVCGDKLCQLADIIFMDAWLPEFSSDKMGTSIVMVRSKRGEALVTKAMKNKVVELQAISIKSVMNSQGMATTVRKVAARRFFSTLPIKSVFPLYESALKPTYSDFLYAFHFKIINMLCQNTSQLSQLIIEYHVTFWNLARSIKKILRESAKVHLT